MSEMAKEAARLVNEIRERRTAERRARGEPVIRVLNIAELMALPSDPLFFEFDEEAQGYCIYWGGYEYFVEFDQLSTPIALLAWLAHIAPKGWELTTGLRIARFIEDVSARRGWDIHARTTLPPRQTENAEERSKLTPQLRYSVFKRDGFACRACGGSAATGSVLHIDHVHPIAKGGRTERDNLQTLCSACNLGKGASQ